MTAPMERIADEDQGSEKAGDEIRAREGPPHELRELVNQTGTGQL